MSSRPGGARVGARGSPISRASAGLRRLWVSHHARGLQPPDSIEQSFSIPDFPVLRLKQASAGRRGNGVPLAAVHRRMRWPHVSGSACHPPSEPHAAGDSSLLSSRPRPVGHGGTIRLRPVRARDVVCCSYGVPLEGTPDVAPRSSATEALTCHSWGAWPWGLPGAAAPGDD
jgi:hypothetical protein